jgi:hypothetical protein
VLESDRLTQTSAVIPVINFDPSNFISRDSNSTSAPTVHDGESSPICPERAVTAFSDTNEFSSAPSGGAPCCEHYGFPASRNE